MSVPPAALAHQAFTLQAAVVDATPVIRIVAPGLGEVDQAAKESASPRSGTGRGIANVFRGVVASSSSEASDRVVLYTANHVWVLQELVSPLPACRDLRLQWTQAAPAGHEFVEVRVDADTFMIRVEPQRHGFGAQQQSPDPCTLDHASIVGGRESLTSPRVSPAPPEPISGCTYVSSLPVAPRCYRRNPPRTTGFLPFDA